MSVQMSDIATYHILDTKPSKLIDNLTQLAVKICKSDVGYVSFFDGNRQWLKSRVGIEESEFQLSDSICNYLVAHNLPYLHIPDLSLDKTFQEHFTHADMGIRFYTGFPLVSSDNSIIGSFCVLGFEPQELDKLQLDFLKIMAEQAMIIVESHKLTIEAERLEKDRSENEQAINYYKSLVNNSTFYLCKASLDRKLTYCNDFYSKEFNVDYTDLGKDLFHAVTPDYLYFAQEAFQVVASGAESKRRVLLKETNSNQSKITNLWDFIAVKNSKNKISEILCLGYDISEIEDTKAQVQLLADYTAFQNKKILEYNTFVFHDIRSHVANANGLINLLELIKDEDDYRHYFKLLKKEIKKTDGTIVALDRISSANADFEDCKEPVSLYRLLEFVFELLRKTKPNLIFCYINKIPEDLIVYSIREYLENIFLNILSNSLKFISPERKMEIEVNSHQIDNSTLKIQLIDNGKGMDLDRYGGDLFKIQSPDKDTKEAKGIGLYLAKKQIEALGGRVEIKSESENGTTVSLELLNHEN